MPTADIIITGGSGPRNRNWFILRKRTDSSERRPQAKPQRKFRTTILELTTLPGFSCFAVFAFHSLCFFRPPKQRSECNKLRHKKGQNERNKLEIFCCEVLGLICWSRNGRGSSDAFIFTSIFVVSPFFDKRINSRIHEIYSPPFSLNLILQCYFNYLNKTINFILINYKKMCIIYWCIMKTHLLDSYNKSCILNTIFTRSEQRNSSLCIK